MNDIIKLRALWVGFIICTILALIFIALFIFGYGKLDYTLDTGESLTVNGHEINNFPVKLRPGSYVVIVRSPRYETTEQQVKIGLFTTRDYSPSQQERALNAIAGSAIGTYGFYGPPELTSAEWFNDNQWLAGVVGPGSSAPIALKYNQAKHIWQVAYFASSGYPSDINKLPSNIATYINTQQIEESAQ